jgi:hypothetical protein
MLMLTKGSERRARRCSVAGDVVRWRVGEELGDGVDAGLLRAPESHGSIRGRAAKPGGGSGRQKFHRRRSISVEAELTCNGGHGEIRWRERAGHG